MISIIKSENLPKILFIKNVYKKDCQTDDIFEKKILENANSIINMQSNEEDQMTTMEDFISYEKLPLIFSNIESWKKKTNIKCWCCTLSFDSMPIFIPNVIEPVLIKNKKTRELSNKQQFSISVYGNFCSFGCAHFFIENSNMNINERTESINKLKLLHKLIYNTKIKETGYYPSPYKLEQFGGDMTIAEYKELQEIHKKENIVPSKLDPCLKSLSTGA